MRLQTNTTTMRRYLTLWGGQMASLLGSSIVQFALIWWLTKETNSGTVLALASLAGLLPQVVLGPFVGVWVDRWSRRRTMLLADSVVAGATLVLALLFWSGSAVIWHVFLVLFVRALAGTFHWPAMNASTVLMVPDKHLTRIQGLNQMLRGGLSIISAPLGALAIETLPLQSVLAIDVFTAAFAIAPLLFIAVPNPPQSRGGQLTYWDDLRAGLRYVWNWKPLMLVIGMALILNFILTPTASLLPLMVTRVFRGEAYHLAALNAAFGIGILVGGALLGVWGGFKNRMVTSLTGIAGLGAGVLLFGLVPASLFPVAISALFLVGLMQVLANGPLQAIMQAVVAPEMQGRVFMLLGSAAAAMAPLGLIMAGPVSDLVGVRIWYILGGAMALVVALAALQLPLLRRIEEGTRVQDPTPAVEGQPIVAPAPELPAG